MARHNPAHDPDEQASDGRLAAMGLRAPPRGWVPEPVVDTEEAPDRGRSPEFEVVGPGGADQPVPPTIGGLLRDWALDRLPAWAAGPVERLRLGQVVSGVVVIVAVVVAGVVVLHHHSAAGYRPASYEASTAGSSYPSDPVVSVAPTVAASSASIVVDVGGRVRKPGLVTLPAGARVADAVAAAGGALHHKAVATLDLAARVTDGELLLIGVKAPAGADSAGSSGDDSGAASGSAAPISLSSATIDELETLPGVGPVTAQQIIDWRTAHNGFATLEQLQEVSGIGPAKYAEISPLVTP